MLSPPNMTTDIVLSPSPGVDESTFSGAAAEVNFGNRFSSVARH